MFTVSLLLLYLAGSVAGDQVINYVDLEEAVLATEAGQAAQRKLIGEREKEQRKIGELQAGLLRRRAEMTDVAYERQAAALNKRIDEVEQRLDTRQTELLDPILGRLGELLSSLAVSERVTIWRLDQVPLIDPPPSCDVTAWLVKAVSLKRPPPFGKKESCKATHLFQVDYELLLPLLEKTRQLRGKIDEHRQKRQAELASRQRLVTEVESKWERTKDPATQIELRRLRTETADLYKRFERELSQREENAKDRLYSAIDRRIRGLKKHVPGVLWAEKTEGVDELTVCDVTSWVRGEIVGQPLPLDRVCPTYQAWTSRRRQQHSGQNQ